MTSVEQVVTGTVERASGTGWRVLRSRFDNAQLVEDVVVLIDSDGPDRGREHYDQRVELPATVFVRVDETSDDVHTARAYAKGAAEARLHSLIHLLVGAPDEAVWTYAWQATATHIGLARPDRGHLYAYARTRIGFSVPTT